MLHFGYFWNMTEISKGKRYLLSILSGLLMVISFPYAGSLTPLVFVSWIPLLLVEWYISSKRYRSGKVFIHAYLTFFIYNLGTTWWIWNASEGGAVMAFILNALLMSIAFQFFHAAKKRLGDTAGYLSLIIFWISFEYLHYHWELSWPWLNFGNTFSITPSIVQWYSVTGILGGTLWILVVNFIGFKIVRGVLLKKEKWEGHKINIMVLLSLIIAPISVSVLQYAAYEEKMRPLEIVVIQPNIDPYNEKWVASVEDQLRKLMDLADKKVTDKTAMVIAPETAISWTFYEEDLLSMPFYGYLKERKAKWKNTSFYTGASTARYFEKRNSRASRKLEDGPGFYESYNSSLLVDEKGEHTFLHKSKLVLGVEKLPFSDWFPFLEELSIENGGTSGTLGIEKEPKVLRSGQVIFAPLICYESIYGGFNAEQCKKGAEAIFIITNDGWWKDTPGYKQHMSFARLRAIENRRSVARSANTGTSCLINQRGDVLQKTDWWESDVIRGTINLNSELTFYSRSGDLLGKTFTLVSLVIISMSLAKIIKPYLLKQ
jgi:apolipoprotein N-acyltransferase